MKREGKWQFVDKTDRLSFWNNYANGVNPFVNDCCINYTTALAASSCCTLIRFCKQYQSLASTAFNDKCTIWCRRFMILCYFSVKLKWKPSTLFTYLFHCRNPICFSYFYGKNLLTKKFAFLCQKSHPDFLQSSILRENGKY